MNDTQSADAGAVDSSELLGSDIRIRRWKAGFGLGIGGELWSCTDGYEWLHLKIFVLVWIVNINLRLRKRPNDKALPLRGATKKENHG